MNIFQIATHAFLLFVVGTGCKSTSVATLTTVEQPFYPVSEFQITGPFLVTWHYSPTTNHCTLTIDQDQAEDIVIQATGTRLSAVNTNYNNMLLRVLTLGIWRKSSEVVPTLEITTSLMPTEIALTNATFETATPLESPKLTVTAVNSSDFRCNDGKIGILSLKLANSSEATVQANGEQLDFNLTNSAVLSISGTYSLVAGKCANSVTLHSGLTGDTLALKLSNSVNVSGNSCFRTVTLKGSNSTHATLAKAETVTCKLTNSASLTLGEASLVQGSMANSATLSVPQRTDCSNVSTANSATIHRR